MKNGKKPSLAHKKIMQFHGLDSSKWLVVKDLTDTLEVVSRIELKRIRNGKPKTKVINKKLA